MTDRIRILPTKSRLAEYKGRNHLTNLLTADRIGKTKFIPVDFQRIQETLLEETGGFILPFMFIDILGLHGLNLYYTDRPKHNVVPILFIGTEHPLENSRLSIQNGTTIIEVHRRIGEDGIIKAHSLRASGVTFDSQQTPRAFGSNYYLDHASGRTRLNQLDISVGWDELASLGLDKTGTRYKRFTKPIPTHEDNPYETAGLITKGMVEQSSNHRVVLNFRDPSGQGRSLKPEFRKLLEISEGNKMECGFLVFTDNLLHTVTFRSQKSDWELSVPRHLFHS